MIDNEANHPSSLVEHRLDEGGSQLWRVPLAHLSEMIDRGDVSPVEVLEQVLGRIALIDQDINAFRYLGHDEARRAAEQAATRALRRERLGPLDGIPVHVKDNIFVRDMPASWGSLLYKDFIPAVDDLPVAALRRAGTVIFGKTTTPEFALLGRTESRIAGITRNPWDLLRTPGGSSGGAAAAVAAGMGPVGLATDAAGSIRRPAAYCGVVGFRPSLDAVPRRYGFPATAHDFQTIGPIAATVADARLVFDAISGSRGPLPGRTGERKCRIGLVLHDPAVVIDPQVRQGVGALAATLSDHGHSLDCIPLPWDLKVVENIWGCISGAGIARIAAGFEEGEWESKATQAILEVARRGAKLSAGDYVLAMDEMQRLRHEAGDWFLAYDYLITPSSPCVAWSAKDAYPSSIGGVEAGPRAAAVFSTAVNVCGLPAISLPAGRDRDGLPIGLQIIGPRGDDLGVFWLASQLEEVGRAAILRDPATPSQHAAASRGIMEKHASQGSPPEPRG